MSRAPSNEAIPAATLIIVRDRADGGPADLLMAERAAVMAFASGALVFPGGRVEPGDLLLAAGAADAEDGAARVAAIRETIEETGIAVGLSPAPGDTSVATLRQGLRAGEDFGRLLGDRGLTLDPDELVPFARWLPPFATHRRFDTRFYLARAPRGATPDPDGAETVAAFWMSAADVLAAAAEGKARIVFPTRRNLERLASCNTFEEAAADAARYAATTITPHIEERDGEDWLCIPDGLGYPVTAERLTEATRN